MKLLFSFLVCFLVSYTIIAQQTTYPKPKLSASAQLYMWKQEKNQRPVILPECVYRKDAQNTTYISTLIQVQPGFNETPLKTLGAQIGTKAGEIWTVQVPLQQVKNFTQVNGIKYIDMDQPVAMAMDTARKMTRVDSVHKGYNLPQAYSGKNVVVGIIDLGFDYTHPTLYDTAYAKYRVKRVWEEKTIGTPPSGFAYGAEFADSASIITKAYDVNNFTHGAHVAGIAGGSGAGGSAGNSTRYRGMAYNSDLVLVSINPTSAYWLSTGMADMLDGMNYIYNYAASVSKPAVANLSWGNPLGPRDGNSLFSQACDNLTGPGKIFGISGGNNGPNRLHIQKTFTNSDSVVRTGLTFPSGLGENRNWVDVWGDTSQPFRMRFSLYNGFNTRVDSSAVISLDNSTHQINLKGTNGDTCFITVSTIMSEFNAKPHMLIQVYSRANNQLILSLMGKSGTVDMWQGLVKDASGYYGSFTKPYPWATQGDLIMQCSDMSCSKSAIAVASYNSKPAIVNVSGGTVNYGSTYPKGAISAFSSHGPSADGRIKPNITGPGMMVVSSISSLDPEYKSTGLYYNRVVSEYTSAINGNTYAYAALQGTSMSGPAVSGIIALLLEANPTLSPQQVMNILSLSAITDANTGIIPPGGTNTWGAGKVNAYKAMQLVLMGVGIYHPTEMPLECLLYPNPNNGNYAIEYVSDKTESIQLTVTTMNGQTLINKSWNVNAGLNIQQIDLSQNAQGIYFTKIISSKGSTTIKIVKH